MKYSETNKPLQCLMTQSTCYKSSYAYNQQYGILWHSTGANNNTVKRYVQPDDNAPNRQDLLNIIGINSNKNDWNHISRSAGVHAFIGKLKDGSIAAVQCLPWNWRPWGCGAGTKGSCNNGWLQFEICEDDLSNQAYFEAVYKEACELTAYLCKMYNIDPLGYTTINGVKIPNITCHNDAAKLGFAGNHADINHWFPKYGKSMETVRQDVAKILNSQSNPTPTPAAPTISTPTQNTNIQETIWNYFMKKLNNPYGVAGLMGNIQAESGFNPINLQNSFEKKLGLNDITYTQGVDNGSYTNFVRDSAGYGLCQWTYWSRKQNLLDFCKSQNKSIGDLNAQLDFLAQELQTQYKTVWNSLLTAKSVFAASNAVLLNFEKPANQSLEVQNTRASYGQIWYDKFAPKTQQTSTPTANTVTTKEAAKSKDAKLAGTYVTTASSLNVREGAGMDKKVMVVIPKGTEVKNYGYYTLVNGVKWFYIQFIYKNISYTGFCSSDYLKKK